MNFKIPVLVGTAFLGAIGGFVIGRSTAPHATATPGGVFESAAPPGSPLSPEDQTALSQNLTAAAPGSSPRPITADELKAVLAAMEKSGPRGMGDLRKMADLQDRLKASDLAAIAASFCASQPTPDRMSGFFLVMSTFAEKDPQAAWNLALATKGQIRQTALSVIVSSVAAKDPARALALADSISETQLKRQLRSAAIMNIAQKDPQKALGYVLDGKGSWEGDYSVSMIFQNWAGKDPEAAKAAIAKLTGRQAEQARQALFSSLAQQDPKAAWDYALTMPLSGETYMDPRLQVLQQWAQSDPQAALKAALSISDSRLRKPALSSTIGAWARSDFNGALKYAVSIEDSTLRADILQSLSGNSQGNRREILTALLDHMPPGDSFRNAVSNLFSRWANENPQEAAAAVAQLPPGNAYSNAASNIVSQWARTASNKQDVFEWAKKLPEGETRSNSLNSLFSTWSATDPQSALTALNSLSADDKKSAARAIASGWGSTSPEAAIQWASATSDAGERSVLMQSAISQWATTSPDAAANYVSRLPESERVASMQAVVSMWASKDTEAAAGWLDRQPAGAAKDASLIPLARKIAQEDPEAALTWVAGISDQNQRLQQVESIARDWLRQSPSDARHWISSSKLPDDLRNRLLKK